MMLQQLKIKNMAVVEDATIDFSEGLNVMTGSTGAGKSIVLTAVELLSGSRAKRSLLRKGAEFLSVEGIFRVTQGWPLAGRLGIQDEDPALSIKREVKGDGKSRLWINGMIATNAAAREITGSLFELHGQHRQQELLSSESHIRYLDQSGDYGTVIEECDRDTLSFRALWKKRQALIAGDRRSRDQEDFLRFQLAELESLGLEENLDVQLEGKIERIQNISKYLSALNESNDLISEAEGSILDKLASVERLLSSISRYGEKWASESEKIGEIGISLKETAREIEREINAGEDEQDDIEELQSRLASLQRAMRKFRLDMKGLMDKRDSLKRDLASIENGSDELIETNALLAKARSELIPRLEELSSRRRRRAADLDKEVTSELQSLGMKGALFVTRIERREISAFQDNSDELDLQPGGWDSVEFRIRTNPGEDILPLAEIASGGELSRITLVLKKLLVRERGISTLVFDEIDSGLGADLGGVVAAKLKELSERFQIVCITHLPQVAAAGDRHVLIEKEIRGKRTVTEAYVIDGERRQFEIARMLGGEGGLPAQLAAQMLAKGKSARSSAG